MHREGDPHGHGAECREQDRPGRTVLHDSDVRMHVRMEMIDETFERRVEELRREHCAACQQHDRPPERSRPQNRQRYDDGNKDTRLKSQTVLGAQRERDPLQGEAQANPERLILPGYRCSIDLRSTRFSSTGFRSTGFRSISLDSTNRVACLLSRVFRLLTHITAP